jgi:ubiquinone biosynthesis accessory factor UbiJ
VLAASLNRMLARSLERSPRARELCAGLEGRRLRIVVRGIPAILEVSASGGRLEATLRRDTAVAAATADVTLTGSPLALLAMASTDARAVVARGAASLEGDEELAQQFQQLARLLRPDLEQALGGLVGRVPAHFAARGLRLLGRWGRDAGESLARNGADYLAHESRDLVPRAEAEEYLGGVEALRTRLADAERRTAALAERLATLAPTPRDGA